MTKAERRYHQADDLKIETRADDNKGTMIAGHAAVFNSLSEDFGGWQERIAPAAFAKSLNNDVRALFNHDSNYILGRTTSRTLRLSEDSTGLYTEIDPPDTEMANHVMSALKRGDVTQMSFGFVTKRDEWEEIDGMAIRTLLEVDLFDVSPVTFPAYAATDAGVRAYRSFVEQNAMPKDYLLRLQKRRMELEEVNH